MIRRDNCALQCANLTLGYDRHPAVHHLEWQVPRGTLTAVVGPNGAGKSTLLKAVAGEIMPLEGHIELGVERKRLAYLPQQNELDLGFPVSVHDFVAMGLWHELGPFGGMRPEHRGRVADTLARVGLAGLEQRPIGALSGGQIQRARFARLMLQDAELLLLDEPFNAIDSRTTEALAHLIEHWHVEGRTIIAVLHDLALVHQVFPHCLLLAREQIASGPTAEALTAHNLAHARALAESFDEHAEVCHRHPSTQEG